MLVTTLDWSVVEIRTVLQYRAEHFFRSKISNEIASFGDIVSLFVKAKLHDFGNIIISNYTFELMYSDGHFQ